MPTSTSTELVTAADRVYAELRDRLALLELAPNEPINDVQIAEELGTGRTPVREAIKRLEQDRLVVSFPRRGTFATTVDITALGNISEIRIRLEPLAAARASRLASSEMRADLSALAEEALEFVIPNERKLVELDMRIHRQIYRAAANPYLEDILIRHDAHARRIWSTFLGRMPEESLRMDAHVGLIRAIVEGREEEAASIAEEHVADFERAVKRLM